MFEHFNVRLKKNKSFDSLCSRLKLNTLFKSILLISSGTLIAQSLTILMTPIITRLYQPSDFGLLSMFLSVTAILLPVTSLRYDFALPLVKKDKDAINLLALCFLLIPIVVCILLASYFLSHGYLSKLFALSVIDDNLLLFTIGVIGASLFQVLSFWAVRDRDYLSITKTRLYQSIGGSSTKVLLGLLAFGPLGLLIGETIAQITGCGKLFQATCRRYKTEFRHISYRNMKAVAVDFLKYPKYTCVAIVINTLALQIPVLYVINIYGLEVGGLYSLAYAILVLPGSIISGAISQVFLGEVSALIKEDPKKIEPLYLDVTKKMALVTVPLVVAIAISAPIIFPHIFGEQWRLAGWYCLPLSLVAGSNLIVSTTSNLSTYGKNDWQLLFDISRTVLIIISMTLGYLLHLGIMLVLLIYALTMAMAYLVDFAMNLHAIRRLNKT